MSVCVLIHIKSHEVGSRITHIFFFLLLLPKNRLSAMAVLAHRTGFECNTPLHSDDSILFFIYHSYLIRNNQICEHCLVCLFWNRIPCNLMAMKTSYNTTQPNVCQLVKLKLARTFHILNRFRLISCREYVLFGMQ